MKKSIFLISILVSALVAGATSAIIISTSNSNINQTSTTSQQNSLWLRNASNDLTINPLPDLRDAAEQGVRAVVNIEVTKRVAVRGGMSQDDMFEYLFGNPQSQMPQSPQFREQKGGGSGVIISTDGYIVSNNHVIDGADQIKVTTNNGQSYTASVVGTDPSTDIALLKIEATGLETLEFGDSDQLRLGDWVLAIGNPYGLTSTVTQGIISAKGRSVGASQNSRLEIESFIQTDAVVNPGNSGGALITLDGRIVGINTMIVSQTGSYAGYSFAVPSSIVKKVVTDIRNHGVVQRAMLGISMREITSDWIEKFGVETGVKEQGGIYIAEVLEGGSAAASGIRKGDVLTAINDLTVTTAAGVQEAIGRLRPNDKVKITVKRAGVVKHFDVTLRNKSGNTSIVTKQAFDLVGELGAQFREITDKQKSELKIKYGIQIIKLDPSGLLSRSRVKTGFIITAINDTPISKPSQLETMNVKGVDTIEGIYPDGTRAIYNIVGK